LSYPREHFGKTLNIAEKVLIFFFADPFRCYLKR